MIPRKKQNHIQRVNLQCPGCGMNLASRQTAGFTLHDQTYCCRGCATGTGCTCKESALPARKSGNKPGHPGKRNPENSTHDLNFNSEVKSTGEALKAQRPRKSVPRQQSRKQRLADGRKAPRSQSESRDSTREAARGRSEFRGAMNKARTRQPGGADRVSVTGSKGK